MLRQVERLLADVIRGELADLFGADPPPRSARGGDRGVRRRRLPVPVELVGEHRAQSARNKWTGSSRRS